jgi:hypothetical protein
MVHLLEERNLSFIFDCGIDDFFYDSNQRLQQKSIKRRISDDYTERLGGDTWEYFSISIKYQIIFLTPF